MYPGTYAAEAPDRAAAVMAGTGETLTYGELERRSVQLAHVLHDAGLRPGDVVALLTENNLRAFEVYWAALRSGLYITAVNSPQAAPEITYIVRDCGAKALIVVGRAGPDRAAIAGRDPRSSCGWPTAAPVPGYGDYEDTIAGRVGRAVRRPARAAPTMLYSSGTTGRPKGVRPPLPGAPDRRARRRPVAAGRACSSASRQDRSTCRPRRSTTPLRCAGHALDPGARRHGRR